MNRRVVRRPVFWSLLLLLLGLAGLGQAQVLPVCDSATCPPGETCHPTYPACVPTDCAVDCESDLCNLTTGTCVDIEGPPTPGTGFTTRSFEFYHLDALGSVRLVTDRLGEVVSRHDYLPFGEEIPVGVGGRTSGMGYGSQPASPVRFTGKERDAETGLDYFGARYYSGAQGRFTGADPKLFSDATIQFPQKWNQYAYARNNPLLFIDPDGRDDVVAIGCSGSANPGACIASTANARAQVGSRPEFTLGVGTFVTAYALGPRLLAWGASALAALAKHGREAEHLAHAAFENGTDVFAEGQAILQRMSQQELGTARESYVADLVGGTRVAKEITLSGFGRTDLDVIAPNGDLVQVGGFNKSQNLSDLGKELMVVAAEAKNRGVNAYYFFTKDTPQSAIKLAQKWFGKENVYLFQDVQ